MSDTTTPTARHPSRDRMPPDVYHAQRTKLLADVDFLLRSCEALAAHHPAYLSEMQAQLKQAQAELKRLEDRWAAQRQPIAWLRTDGQLRLVLSDGSNIPWPGDAPAGLTEVGF